MSADTSASVTFERNTYIVSRFLTDSAMSAGSSMRKPSSGGEVRHRTKLAIIRPFGELKLAYRNVPGASALTSADNCPCRKAAASAPAIASTRSGARSQTTAPSRAATRSASAEDGTGVTVSGSRVTAAVVLNGWRTRGSGEPRSGAWSATPETEFSC